MLCYRSEIEARLEHTPDLFKYKINLLEKLKNIEEEKLISLVTAIGGILVKKNLFIRVIFECWLKSLAEKKIDFLLWVRDEYSILKEFFPCIPEEPFRAFSGAEYVINDKADQVLETWLTNQKIAFLCAQMAEFLKTAKDNTEQDEKNRQKKSLPPKVDLSNAEFKDFFVIPENAEIVLDLFYAIPSKLLPANSVENFTADKTKFIGEKSIFIQWGKALRKTGIIKHPIAKKKLTNVAPSQMLNLKFPNYNFLPYEIAHFYQRTSELVEYFEEKIEKDIKLHKIKNR